MDSDFGLFGAAIKEEGKQAKGNEHTFTPSKERGTHVSSAILS